MLKGFFAFNRRTSKKKRDDVTQFADTARAAGLMLGGIFILLLPATAIADDYLVKDTVVYWGTDFAHNSASKMGIGLDGGFVTALNGDIGATGWTFTGSLGVSRTDDALSDSNSFYGTALFGHQWHAPNHYVSLSGGVIYTNNDENPSGGATDGGAVGAIVQYGFETKAVDALYVQSYGAYATAYDQIYVHAKTGYKTANLRFGPEITLFDDESSRPTLRYGGFLGDISITDSLNMVVTAGYQHELEVGVADGFYATIGFSIPISLR